jgi:CRP-like cAMP-binding protein
MSNALWALTLGILATLALPIGAVIGMMTRPKPRITGALAGYGAGALFAALSIELVAPTMLKGVEGGGITMPLALLIGGALGGIIFVLLDRLLNEHGGYLRKTATAIMYLTHRRSERLARIMDHLSQSQLFRSIPPEYVHLFVERLHETTFHSGETIFEEGAEGDRLYILEDGTIELTRDGAAIGTLQSGDILGEIALIANSPRTATAEAKATTHVMELSKRDFDYICRQAPEVGAAVKDLASRRLEELGNKQAELPPDSAHWARTASQALRHGHRVPTPKDLKNAAESHSNAPLAIWLGALMDGIPESFVLGTSFYAILIAKGASAAAQPLSAIPLTLLAGLFLSNFPEAMSSSVGMAAQGWSKTRILVLWCSLMVICSILTMGGFAFGEDVPKLVEVGAEGLAAGAMLTMIAQTMIPEAVHLGGGEVVGLSTLAGFLSAVGFKLVEG